MVNKNNNVGNLKGKYIGICLCLGTAIGLGLGLVLVFGSVINQIGIGLLVGVAVGCSGGLLVGSILKKIVNKSKLHKNNIL